MLLPLMGMFFLMGWRTDMKFITIFSSKPFRNIASKARSTVKSVKAIMPQEETAATREAKHFRMKPYRNELNNAMLNMVTSQSIPRS